MSLKITDLKSIKPSNFTVFYGKPGTGKTKYIESLPGKVLVIDTDNGLSTIRNSKADISIVSPKDFGEVLEAVDIAKDFDSVAVDHLTNIQQLCYKDVKKDSKIEKMTLQAYGEASQRLKGMIDKLVGYANSGKNVYVIAQQKRVEDDDEPAYFSPDLQSGIVNYLTSNARVIGCTEVVQVVAKDKDTGKQKKQDVHVVTLKGGKKSITKVTTPTPEVVKKQIANPTFDKINSML